MPDLPRDLPGHLLPHTGTSRLLTALLRSEPGFLEGVGQVPATHPLVVGGHAPCFLGLELGAQAAAALEALQRAATTGDDAPRIGYLVRVREAVFLRPELPVDTSLYVTARLSGAAPPLAIYQIRVDAGGVESVRASITTLRGGVPWSAVTGGTLS